MANLESSWEETVVKLAQAGNLRAIAFWLNRYLVAQGICVQATTDQPGQLTLQILCRQTPDRDRLVQFICHELCQLNSPVIRSVQLKAQLIGSAELLWTQTANLTPVSPLSAVSSTSSAIEAETEIPVREAERATVPPRAERAAEPVLPVPVAVSAASNAVLIDPAASVLEELPSANVPSANAPSAAVAFQPTPPKSKPGIKPSALRKPQSLKQKTGHWLKQSQQQVQRSGHQLRQSAEQSIQWFQQQKPRQKAVILGSSAAAAFLLGCGFELVRYQVTIFTARSQNPEAAAGASYQGMVKTAIEQVPVIQLAAANPSDPAITLLFSNAVTLSGAAGQPGIAAQQNADMLITSLNAPLSGLAGISLSRDNSATSTSLPSAATSPDVEPGESAQTAAPSPDSPALQLPEGESSVSPDAAANSAGANPADPAATDPSEELPPVNLPPLTLQQLQANRASVVNLASNQIVQAGGDALTQTIKSLSQASIYPIGAGVDQQSARRPQIFSIKGKRIAYLGYSDVSLQTAAQNSAGLNTSINAQVEADIKSIRSQVDWVIVSYHWNQNLRSYPEDWQVSLTHAAIDHGADLVVGYHPTVTQGAEVYGGRAIVYSLGSMLDPYQHQDGESPKQYETLALKLSLQDKQMQVDLLPVRVSGGQTEVLTAETGTSILDYLKQASSLFRQPLRSPTTLDAQIRLTLPAAPNSDQPFSAPFTSDSSSSPSSSPSSDSSSNPSPTQP